MEKPDVLHLSCSNDFKLSGRIQLSASKSISNRLLIIQALCEQQLELENLASAADTQILQQILQQYKVQQQLDIGAAGTSMRFLTAFLAMQKGAWLLTGSERMQERPIAPLVQALRTMGAQIAYVGKEGYPPLQISGAVLQGNRVELAADQSSQFISALVLIAPSLAQDLSIVLRGKLTSRPYLQLTLDLMHEMGAAYSWEGNTIKIKAKPYQPKNKSFSVEADWSSASYWYAFAALNKDADMYIEGLQRDSLQGDCCIVELFDGLGVATEYTPTGIHLTSKSITASSFDYDFTDCPDLAQTFAVVLAALDIPARLSGLHTLRIKETDRIAALLIELNKLGFAVSTEADDVLLIQKRVGALDFGKSISSYEDHRMALAFAPLVLLKGSLAIENPAVVKKSYPEFWEDMRKVRFLLGYDLTTPNPSSSK